MPKTASKRAEARKVARVQRAHEALPQRPASAAIKRRVPLAAARAEQRGVTTLIRDYPWATTIFFLLLVGLVFVVMSNQHLGPWAPKAARPQTTCDLKTHTCKNGPPPMTINTSHYYSATLKTKYGDIVIQLDAANAPIAVNNFVFLARQHFYDGLTFNRVEHIGQISPLTNQPSNLDLIQGGAGGGKGGGPGYTLQFESPTGSYVPGTVAVANESQFFITLSDMTSALSGSPSASKFDIFGHVTAGLDIAKKIALNDTIQSVTIGESTVVPTPAPTLTPTTAPTNTPAPTATPKK